MPQGITPVKKVGWEFALVVLLVLLLMIAVVAL